MKKKSRLWRRRRRRPKMTVVMMAMKKVQKEERDRNKDYDAREADNLSDKGRFPMQQPYLAWKRNALIRFTRLYDVREEHYVKTTPKR